MTISDFWASFEDNAAGECQPTLVQQAYHTT